MTTTRESILGRVRAAMRVQGARPAPATDAPLFADVTDPPAAFHRTFVALKGEIVESKPALHEFLAGFSRIASDGSRLVEEAIGAGTAGADVRDADLGVTSCDCVVAALGAIIVSVRSAGGRALSVLPPVHLVIARRDQLVADLAGALALVRGRYDGRWPSTLSILAGPSRTGDIEKIIVMGAHGPKRLALYWAE